MLMHSIKMTIHLLLKKKKKKKKTLHLSYYHRLRLFTPFHPKLEFGSKIVSL